MLSQANLIKYSLSDCPICHSADYHPIARVPIGYPVDLPHTLMFFDERLVDIDTVLPMRGLLDRTMGFKVSVPWNFCNRCMNASVAMEMTEDHLNSYYSQYYKRAAEIHVHRKATKQLHGQYLCGFLESRSRVLEIGAADGFTAEYVAAQGHEVVALEPSPNYREQLARISGVTAIGDMAQVEAGSLDAVYLHHVYEHVVSPIDFAGTLRRLLRPGGLLLIQVPDLASQLSVYQRGMKRSVYRLFNRPAVFRENIEYDFWSVKNSHPWLDALLHEHVSAFTPEGLRYVLGKSGFQVETTAQSTADTITWDPDKYSWPVDVVTGNPPNCISVIARS